MVNDSQNTIQQAALNFRVNVLRNQMVAGDDFVAWAKHNVLEAIDHHAENLVEPHSIVEVPELIMNIDIDKELDFFKVSDEVRATIWNQVYSDLKKAINQNETLKVPLEDYHSKIVMSYLQNGLLHEYDAHENWEFTVAAFIESLKKSGQLRNELIRIVQNKGAFIRFYKLKEHFWIPEVLRYFGLNKDAAKTLTTTFKVFKKHKDYFTLTNNIIFYYRLFQLIYLEVSEINQLLPRLINRSISQQNIDLKKISIPKEIRPFFKEAIKSRFPELEIAEDKTEKQQLKAITMETKEGTYVGQAGLVLLAPFLQRFLKNMGHIGVKGQLIRKKKVPMLLHYLATGESSAPEWKLSLPKILSGMQLGEHCSTNLRPTEQLDNQIDELLKAVIGYWDALKNTSPGGLRATFLVREAILKYKNGFYYLYVDEQTVDILLNYVSWNYTTIRLDWMNEILFVEWNKS